MADISRLSRLLNGVQRQVDISANTLVVDNLKVKLGGANSFTFSGTLTSDRTISMPDANVDLADIALNTAARHAAVTLNTDDPTQQTLNLSGQEIQVNLATASTDGAMSAEDKSKLDGIEAGATADQIASEVPYTNTTSGLTASNVQAAIDEVEGRLDTAESDITAVEADVADLVTLSGLAANSTSLGIFSGSTIPDNQTIKQAIQALETAHEANADLLAGWEWQNSSLDYITNNTLFAPPTEVSGDRYVLSADGGTPNPAWDGASAGDIVEFDGSVWVATTPTVGMIISVDDESTSLRQWSGSAWVQKFFESTTASTGLTKVGFDIRLADAATNASGIQVASGAITLENLSAFDTGDLAEGTNLYFTEARVLASILAGLDVATNGTVAATDSVLAAIGKLAANQSDLVTLSGVAQGSVDLGTFTGTTIADNSDIKSALQALETAVEEIDTSADLTHTQADTNDWTVADGSTVAAHLDELADRVTSLEGGTAALTSDETPNAALGTGLRAVRWAQDAETAGQIRNADNDASVTDNFYVVGVVSSDNSTNSQTMYRAGLMPAASHGLTIGKPFYLGAAGVLTSTAPTAADSAVVKLGIVKDANTLDIQIQVMGVN